MQPVTDFINTLNGILFSNFTVYALLAAGVVFTVWSVFGQARALTHGVAVTRGKYDDKNDPGAINHFQALSAALSATVGLGNIGGVAVAVALGGPGAILWMWVIGLLGMALKMTEVTQSMLYRNTDDPDNPHGGPMFVVKKGLTESPQLRMFAGFLFAAITIFLTVLAYRAFNNHWFALVPGIILAGAFAGLGLVRGAALGTLVGGVFVVTLIISAITGGNMFQVWNVGDITHTYHQVPQVVTSIVLSVLVGLVIIGGIKRIGAVAGRIVPFMCVVYVLAAAYVLANNIAEIPAGLALIVKSGLPPFLGGEAPDATGASWAEPSGTPRCGVSSAPCSAPRPARAPARSPTLPPRPTSRSARASSPASSPLSTPLWFARSPRWSSSPVGRTTEAPRPCTGPRMRCASSPSIARPRRRHGPSRPMRCRR